MVGRQILISTALMALATLGCFYHQALISIEPSSAAPALSSSERQAALAAITPALEKLNFFPDPRLDDFARVHRESPEITSLVVGAFRRHRDARPGNRIEVRAHVEKGTGKFVVLMTDYTFPFSTKFADQIEQAIAAALRKKFPDYEVHVETRISGPNLGP